MPIALRPSPIAAAVLIAGALLVSSAATAQDRSGQRIGSLAVCRADVNRLCPNALGTGRGGIECLRDNTEKLSPECAAAFTDIETKTKAMQEACAGDVATHCRGDTQSRQDGPATVQCLRLNAAKLTAGCTAAMQARYPTD